jgi:hypothetical protein
VSGAQDTLVRNRHRLKDYPTVSHSWMPVWLYVLKSDFISSDVGERTKIAQISLSFCQSI